MGEAVWEAAEMALRMEKSGGDSRLDPLQWLQQKLYCGPYYQTHQCYKLNAIGSRPKDNNFLKIAWAVMGSVVRFSCVQECACSGPQLTYGKLSVVIFFM